MTDFKPDSAPKVLIRELGETEIVQNIGQRLTNRRDSLVDDALDRMRRDEEAEKPKIKVAFVFLRWDVDPKTKKRGTTVLGVHTSMQSAQLALPEDFQKLVRKYPPDSPYIQNYINKAIERRPLE